MNFESMLDEFSQAAAAGDARRLTHLFTSNGCYHDYFFGTHRGRDAIGAMLERFSVGDERFAWQFLEPVANAQLGYARYCFSYLSKEPESRGRLIVFEGMSRFRLQDGLIADYAEVFDRGTRLRNWVTNPRGSTICWAGMRRAGVMVKRCVITWPGANG